MTFLNNNLNKPKLNGIKKPSIKIPKLEPKTEVKPEVSKTKEVKETNEIEFNPTPVDEPKVEEVIPDPEQKEIVAEEKENAAEEQQTFDDFKTLEETEKSAPVEEVIEKEVDEETPVETSPEESSDKEEIENEIVEEPVVEEKPKKKTRKRTTKAKKEETVEPCEPIVAGSNDLEFIEESLAGIINPTNEAWEEEKVIVNSKMDEIMIDSDMTSADMDEMLAKLSHLENDVRQRLDEISPLYFNVKDLIDYIETTAGTGSTATERKAAGKVICTRYVKEPGAAPVNLYTLFNFQRARYDFYKSKMEQIKNENGRLITLSAVKKIECSLSR